MSTLTYRGTPEKADVSYAFGYLGDMMFQCIQQHDEKKSIYRGMFANGEEGFHHVDPLNVLQAFAQWRRAHELLRPGDSPFLKR